MAVVCCVPTCSFTSKDGPMHSFPARAEDNERCVQWLNLVQNTKLFEVPKKKLLKSYKICHRHFSKTQRIPVSNRNRSTLIRYAVPDLLLPPKSEPTVSQDLHTLQRPETADFELCNSPGMKVVIMPSASSTPSPPEIVPISSVSLNTMELRVKQQFFCLFCRSTLQPHLMINIQRSRTKEGNIIIEEFIRESILELPVDESFQSSFLCLSCFKLINEFEGYLIKGSKIQELLVGQFFSPME